MFFGLDAINLHSKQESQCYFVATVKSVTRCLPFPAGTEQLTNQKLC